VFDRARHRTSGRAGSWRPLVRWKRDTGPDDSAAANLIPAAENFFCAAYSFAASQDRSIAINAASDVEMGFAIHIELPPMTVDRLSNVSEQRVAFRWLHHPVVRLRA
jgi:hypothetical protein